jgi:iron complex outermembrane recepter protein
MTPAELALADGLGQPSHVDAWPDDPRLTSGTDVPGVRGFTGACLAILLMAWAPLAPGSGDTRDGYPVQEANAMDAVVVTGSLLPSTLADSGVPLTSVGSTELEDTGVNADLLAMLRKDLPQFSGSTNMGVDNAGGQAFYTMGGSCLAVHNLTTLVLINGRRVAFDPAEAAVGGEFVDINLVPPSAIERVEVVSDGASALYGSDAVGGVVNLILKEHFNGWESGVHWGETDNRGHYTERSAYLAGGVSSSGGSIMVSVEASAIDPVFESQRPYSSYIAGGGAYPGLVDVYNLQKGTDAFYLLNPALSSPTGGSASTIDQLVRNGTYLPLSAQQAYGGYNVAPQQTLTE